MSEVAWYLLDMDIHSVTRVHDLVDLGQVLNSW